MMTRVSLDLVKRKMRRLCSRLHTERARLRLDRVKDRPQQIIRPLKPNISLELSRAHHHNNEIVLMSIWM